MDEGQTAATRYEVLASGTDGALLLACRLERSGRTHQIRVHAHHIGAPLLGDEMYGGSRVVSHPAAPKRVALHAWRFQAPHPSRAQALRLE
ncbi:yhcT, partial [Symbiodinium natans]